MPQNGSRDHSRQGSDPFDLWFRRSLHVTHDPVAEEPVPRDLLRLASDSRAEWEAYRTRWLESHDARR